MTTEKPDTDIKEEITQSSGDITAMSEKQLDAVAGGGAGSGAGRVRLSEIQVSKRTDASSPL